MYDALSSDYDRFVNWQSRLSVELPFIIEKLHATNAKTILDAATGTGMHAISLAQCGFNTNGADSSPGMIARARSNAKSIGVDVRFEIAGFGTLAKIFGPQTFNALLCLGNSLPHIVSPDALSGALHDFADCLQPGGLLLLQNRNFDFVMQARHRWMEPQSRIEGDTEWLFQRFYDFEPDGLLTFNMIILKRIGKGNWTQQATSSPLRPILKNDLVPALQESGFTIQELYGDMAGSEFDPSSSPNLVVVARRSG